MLAWLGPTHEDAAPPLTARRGKEIVITWKGKPPMRLDDGFIEAPEGKARIVLTLDKDKLTILMPKAAKRPVARPRAKAKAKPAPKARSAAKPKTRAKPKG